MLPQHRRRRMEADGCHSHTPAKHCDLPGQTLPHALQSTLLFIKLTHSVSRQDTWLHWDGPPHFLNPLSHVTTHLPLLQPIFPFCRVGHAWPHLPQFALLFCKLTHFLPHFLNPLSQITTHLPLLQPASPFLAAGHAWPHLPQFATLPCKLMHFLSHSV